MSGISIEIEKKAKNTIKFFFLFREFTILPDLSPSLVGLEGRAVGAAGSSGVGGGEEAGRWGRIWQKLK